MEMETVFQIQFLLQVTVHTDINQMEMEIVFLDTTLTSCASGFETDNQGGCIPITIPLTPASSASPVFDVCPSGFKSDGEGNCVASSIPAVCATGYNSDGNGNCVSDSTPLPNPCPSGQTSDGEGNCIPVSVQVTCQYGYETDTQGNCVPILPTSTSPMTPFTLPVASCLDGLVSDGAGGCIPQSVQLSCAIG
jgi:hypothetical protein